MTASRLSHLNYKWTMGNAERENRRYTFADFVAAANYLHKQISTEANSTCQECLAVPTMQSSLSFIPLQSLRPPAPSLRVTAHNDFWLVALTYARYFEQTRPFYLDSGATRVPPARTRFLRRVTASRPASYRGSEESITIRDFGRNSRTVSATLYSATGE